MLNCIVRHITPCNCMYIIVITIRFLKEDCNAKIYLCSKCEKNNIRIFLVKKIHCSRSFSFSPLAPGKPGWIEVGVICHFYLIMPYVQNIICNNLLIKITTHDTFLFKLICTITLVAYLLISSLAFYCLMAIYYVIYLLNIDTDVYVFHDSQCMSCNNYSDCKCDSKHQMHCKNYNKLCNNYNRRPKYYKNMINVLLLLLYVKNKICMYSIYVTVIFQYSCKAYMMGGGIILCCIYLSYTKVR